MSTATSARAWLATVAVSLLCLLATAAWAQDDPPGRVGRLADMQGGVSWYDHEQGSWGDAERNRPVTTGDRLSTGPNGRVEVRIGSTVLRLGAATELEVLRLDDERLAFQLHTGSLALRVRTREKADETELVTGEARFLPTRAGHYRFDRVDDSTQAGVWRGALRIDDPMGFTLDSGQRAELWREGRGNRGPLKFAWTQMPSDAFGDWVARDDASDDRTASNRYVSPEMTGAEELDRHGRWDRHPEYGAIWYPGSVSAGWAPYRYGRWVWVRPWGWTWVDDSPWGFAPFHYGRWVTLGGRWGWCPGEYQARPVYAPALVAWVNRPGVSVSINIGGPTVGWVPLAPREWYVPQYRHTPVYIDRVNPRAGVVGPRPPRERQVPTGPVMYTNQGVPGGVTVVPRDVLERRQPVGRAVVDVQPVGNAPQQPWVAAQPPQRERGEAREDRRDERRDERRDDRRDDRRDGRNDRGEDRRDDRREDRRDDRREDRRDTQPPPRVLPAPAVQQPIQPVQPVQPAPQGPSGPGNDPRRDRANPPPASAGPRPVQPAPQPPPAAQQPMPRPTPVMPAPVRPAPQAAPAPQAPPQAAPPRREPERGRERPAEEERKRAPERAPRGREEQR